MARAAGSVKRVAIAGPESFVCVMANRFTAEKLILGALCKRVRHGRPHTYWAIHNSIGSKRRPTLYLLGCMRGKNEGISC